MASLWVKDSVSNPVIPDSTIPRPPGVIGTVVRIAFARVTNNISDRVIASDIPNAWIAKKSLPTSVNQIRRLIINRNGTCPKLSMAPC